VQQALDVDRQHPVPLGDRRVGHRAGEHDARVVDHDVQPAEFGDGSFDRGLGLVLAGDVRFQDERGAVQLVGQGAQAVAPPGLPEQHEQAARLLDLLMAGLRP
jgi:hypothetical protein